MRIVPQTILDLKWSLLPPSQGQNQILTWWQENQILTWWQELQETQILTWWQELQAKFVNTLTLQWKPKKRFPTAPLVLHQGNRRRRAPQVNLNFAVRIPLQHLRQTKFCWPFKKWQRTVIQPISTTISAESRNCRNPSQRQCPRLMENQKNSNCSNIYSKQAWKFITSLLKKTRLTISTLSCVVMLYKLSKTSLAPIERIWQTSWLFRRKYVKSQSMARAKHKFQRLVFNPANQKLIDFLDELQKLAKDAFELLHMR